MLHRSRTQPLIYVWHQRASPRSGRLELRQKKTNYIVYTDVGWPNDINIHLRHQILYLRLILELECNFPSGHKFVQMNRPISGVMIATPVDWQVSQNCNQSASEAVDDKSLKHQSTL